MAGRKNLFDLVFKKKDFGIGATFTRRIYDKHPGTYWTITAVRPSTKNGTRAKLKGYFTFKNRPQTRDGQVWERQVRSPLKKEWYEFDAAQSAEQDSTSKLV